MESNTAFQAPWSRKITSPSEMSLVQVQDRIEVINNSLQLEQVKENVEEYYYLSWLLADCKKREQQLIEKLYLQSGQGKILLVQHKIEEFAWSLVTLFSWIL